MPDATVPHGSGNRIPAKPARAFRRTSDTVRHPVLIALALGTTLGACARGEPARPNVLVVTIDTLRPDAVGVGTPAIDAFFRDATRFRATRAAAPLTLPSHTSIFSGLLPAHHGTHDNVAEALPPRDGRPFPLLAEQFKDAGYATAAFVARPVLAASTGIGQGFDLYDAPQDEGTYEDEGGYIPAEERIRAPIAWIDGMPRGKPWFAWVHFFDAHSPYRAFPGDARRAATQDGDPPHVRYAGEVRRVDAALEKLLREVPPDTIVVLASDHGEALDEHDEPGHGPLCYGATLDVLLAVRGGGFAKGREDTGLRSLMDIAPTLRRICGLPAAETDGLDLSGAPHETLVSESLFTWGIHGWGQCFAVTDGAHSLVEGGSSLELFDRRSDRGETHPLPLTDPAYEKLDRALEAFRARPWVGGDDHILGSVAPYGTLRRAETGYLSRHENAKLLSPRDHLKDWVALESIPPLVRVCTDRHDTRPLEDALKRLDAIGHNIPQSPRVDHYRASVLAALAYLTGSRDRYSAAARSELEAIEKGYVHEEAIVATVTNAVAAEDPDVLAALTAFLRRSGRNLSPDVERALADAVKRLGTDALAAYSMPSR
jgi:hypothetical protein